MDYNKAALELHSKFPGKIAVQSLCECKDRDALSTAYTPGVAEPLPFPIEGAAIYYVGPTPERPGCAIGAAGPTTSGRMDAYTPRLLDLGLACMIGKGKRTDAVKQSVVKNGAVYLAAIGGAGALMAGSVQSCEIIAWPDLGCEAVRKLVVKDFPLTVLLDTHGGDLYQSGPAAYLASREHNA